MIDRRKGKDGLGCLFELDGRPCTWTTIGGRAREEADIGAGSAGDKHHVLGRLPCLEPCCVASARSRRIAVWRGRIHGHLGESDLCGPSIPENCKDFIGVFGVILWGARRGKVVCSDEDMVFEPTEIRDVICSFQRRWFGNAVFWLALWRDLDDFA